MLTLLGAIEAHASSGTWGEDRLRLTAAVSAAMDALGKPAYRAAMAAGARMAPTDVLAFAQQAMHAALSAT